MGCGKNCGVLVNLFIFELGLLFICCDLVWVYWYFVEDRLNLKIIKGMVWCLVWRKNNKFCFKKVNIVIGVEYLDEDGQVVVFFVIKEVIFLVGLFRILFVLESLGVGN